MFTAGYVQLHGHIGHLLSVTEVNSNRLHTRHDSGSITYMK